MRKNQYKNTTNQTMYKRQSKEKKNRITQKEQNEMRERAAKITCIGYEPVGYEPPGLTVHPPPSRMIEGGFIFFVWVSSVTKIFSKKKGDFVGEIRIGTRQNVVLRNNHLNPISTKMTSIDNNE